MTWRTIVIENSCKLSYKNDYLIIRNDNVRMVHLSEINTLIIDSTAVTITSYLIAELLSRKIKRVSKIVWYFLSLRENWCQTIFYFPCFSIYFWCILLLLLSYNSLESEKKITISLTTA